MKIALKKFFGLFVVVAMLFGMIPLEAIAAGTSGNNDFTYGGIGDGISIIGYNGNGGEVVIPETLGASKIVSIGRAAFSHCDEITSIVIPGGVTSIGEEAFYHCNGLTNIEIPDSVSFIDECAFEYCDKLTSILIPEGVSSISSYTFTRCSRLTSITIPDGVTSIGWSSFSYCPGLTSIVIPDSVNFIDGSAFYGHNESLVIYGLEDSYAETYAHEQGIQFSVNKDAQIAQAVSEQINELPVMDSLKLTDKVAVTEARIAYDKLTNVQKALVKNLDKLIKTEKRIADLETGENFQIPLLSYQTHIQNVGWQNYVQQGEMSGTEGKSFRLEGIRIKLDDDAGFDLGIQYQTHIQNIGWEVDTDRGWKKSDDFSGTEGLGYRLEAIQIKLTGADSDKFDIYYQVHAQNYGWLDWAKNGESSGTAGYGYRLEAIRITIVPKGESAPGLTIRPFVQK